MVRGKIQLVKQWLWAADMAVAGLAILILLIGLVLMPRLGTTPTGITTSQMLGPKAESAKNNSALIAAAEAYHNWHFPKPKAPPKVELPPPPKEDPKPPVVVQAPPVVTPPPPPAPVIPPPNFTLDFTMVFANRYGLASIKQPSEQNTTLVKLGEVVDNYKITRISDGEMELLREGKIFTLKVPAPNPAEIQAAVAANPQPVPGRPNLQTYPGANNTPRPGATPGATPAPNPGMTPVPTPGYTPPPAVTPTPAVNTASKLPSGPGPIVRPPQRTPLRR